MPTPTATPTPTPTPTPTATPTPTHTATPTPTPGGLAHGSVQVQDGAGNVPDSLQSGDIVVVLIRDTDLHGSSTGEATWTNIPEQVQAYDVWNLVTGSPHPSVHTLSASGYDTAAPENTPLLTVMAEVNGVPNIVSDFDFDPGYFELPYDVNAASALVVTFTFDGVDSFSPRTGWPE